MSGLGLPDINAKPPDDRRAGFPTPLTHSYRSPKLWFGLMRDWADHSLTREWMLGRFFLWLPAALGLGILFYFALPREPLMPARALLAIGAIALAILLRHRHLSLALAIGLAAIACGMLAMKLRTDFVAARVLTSERNGEVTGFLVGIDRLGANGARLTILVRKIAGIAPEATPRLVRVTLRSPAKNLSYGEGIKLRAGLPPPEGPPLPGGYDFAFASFYQGIGATGFAFAAPDRADLGPPPLALRLMKPLADLRHSIGQRIEDSLPGEQGRIAVALIVGDQGGISQDTLADLRASGLAHILSISGLHMVLVAGVALFLIRAGFALIPAIALRYPTKQWAAATALVISTVYLGLSGADVPAQRSYVMLAIMLIAVLLGRRALSLRNVALSALLVLLLTPEALLSASFQMSFAAAAAIVSAFEAVRRRGERSTERVSANLFRRIVHSGGTMFLTSLVAGLATTPFAAFHFQRLAPLSILANLLATPAVSVLVMPMALAAVLLMPFGLERLALLPMRYGLDIVHLVGDFVAGLSEGFGGTKMAPPIALLLVVIGFLWLLLWREKWRLLGAVPILAGLLLALSAPRPDIIVQPDGARLASRGADGMLKIVGTNREGFVVDSWLRADADRRQGGDKTLTQNVRCDRLGCIGALRASTDLVALVREASAFAEDCQRALVVVSALAAPDWCANTALVIDKDRLASGGAQAIYLPGEGFPAEAKLSRKEKIARLKVESAYPKEHRPFMPPLPLKSGG